MWLDRSKLQREWSVLLGRDITGSWFLLVRVSSVSHDSDFTSYRSTSCQIPGRSRG